jgi:hypothetical protein
MIPTTGAKYLKVDRIDELGKVHLTVYDHDGPIYDKVTLSLEVISIILACMYGKEFTVIWKDL